MLRQGCAECAEHVSVEARPQEVGESGLGHPAGARKMAIVDNPCPFGFAPSVEAKDDFHCLLPVGALLRCVEEPDIVRKVALVLARKMGLVWRTVVEWSDGHRKPLSVHSSHCEIEMNRFEGGAESTNRCTGCIVLVATGYRQ